MKGLLFFIFLVFVISVEAQDYTIGYRSMNLVDETRKDRKVKLEVFYPADSAGENVALSSQVKEKLALVIFTHGYLSKIKSYKNIQKMLVPEGYIVAFPATEQGLFPNHLDLAEDIVFLAERIPSFSDDTGSIFYQRIDTALCLMGHSMGGGCSFVAAGMMDDVDALVTLAAYDTNPSAIEAASKLTLPSLVIGGSRDAVTRPEKHQIPMYEALKSAEKTFVNILGGSHCQMSDQHKTCRLGEWMLLSNPRISREEQHAILDTLVVSWMDYMLKGEVDAGEKFRRFLEGEGGIEYRVGMK